MAPPALPCAAPDARVDALDSRDSTLHRSGTRVGGSGTRAVSVQEAHAAFSPCPHLCPTRSCRASPGPCRPTTPAQRAVATARQRHRKGQRCGRRRQPPRHTRAAGRSRPAHAFARSLALAVLAWLMSIFPVPLRDLLSSEVTPLAVIRRSTHFSFFFFENKKSTFH